MARRVLVIERDGKLLELMVQALRAEGFETDSAGGVDEALSRFVPHAHAVVVSDLPAPAESLSRFVARFRHESADTSLVLMAPEANVQFVQTEGHPRLFLLCKPFEFEELVSIVRSAAEAFANRRENLKYRALLSGFSDIFAPVAPDERLRIILDLLIDTLDCDSGSLMLTADDEPALEIRSCKGLHLDDLVGRRQPLEEGIAGFVASNRRPLLLAEGRDDVAEVSALMKRSEIDSAMSIPLVAHHKLYGVINLNRERGRRPFSEENFELAQHFAATLAVVVESTERMLAMERQLVLADKLSSLGHLTAGIAHEIRNPLTVIQLAGEALRLHLDGKMRERADLVVRNVERIMDILKEIRLFYRPSPDEMGPVDLNEVAHQALSAIRFQRRQSGRIVFEEAFASDIPTAHGNGNRLLQVVMNLLLNATQAIPGAGKISVRTGATEGEVFLEVEDTGKGIPGELLVRIFQPFYSTRHDRGGTGLGLSISRSIVREAGGDLTVRSRVGEGSCFRMSLRPHDSLR